MIDAVIARGVSLLAAATFLAAPATALELTPLATLPYDRAELVTAPATPPTLRIAAGEVESLPIRLSGARGPIAITTSGGAGLAIELEQVGWVEVAAPRRGTRPDPLRPLPLAPVTRPELLWFTVRADRGAAGRHVVAVVATAGQLRAELEVAIEVVPIVLPGTAPTVLQAAIANRPRRPELVRSALETLARHRVNAFAGGVTAGEARRLESWAALLEYAFSELGYVHARVPSEGMFTWEKGLVQLEGRGEPARAAWVERHRAYIAAIAPVLDDPRFRGRLAAKLWDEPSERQYGQVVRLAELARAIRPDLPLELTEAPSPRLAGAADIWVVPIRWLLGPSGARRPATGRTWLYANGLHGIDRPSHSLRLIGWLLWAHALDGYHFWSVDHWRADPWTTVSSPDADSVKRGTLLYPGPDERPFLASIRLARFRDGIEDMLLVRRLAERAPDDPLLARLRRRVVAITREELPRPPDPAPWRDRVIDRLLELEVE